MQCIYFRNVLCRLKPQLPSEDCNTQAFCHFSAEALKHRPGTLRALLEDAYNLPLGFTLGCSLQHLALP